MVPADVHLELEVAALSSNPSASSSRSTRGADRSRSAWAASSALPTCVVMARILYPDRHQLRETTRQEHRGHISPYAIDIAVTNVSKPAVIPLTVWSESSWSTLLEAGAAGHEHEDAGHDEDERRAARLSRRGRR